MKASCNSKTSLFLKIFCWVHGSPNKEKNAGALTCTISLILGHNLLLPTFFYPNFNVLVYFSIDQIDSEKNKIVRVDWIIGWIDNSIWTHFKIYLNKSDDCSEKVRWKCTFIHFTMAYGKQVNGCWMHTNVQAREKDKLGENFFLLWSAYT